MLLAGLISERDQKSQAGIPGIRDIKFIGDLLGNTSHTKTRSEIIIFIRPQIIRDGADASMVAEELRTKMRGDRVQASSLPAMLNINARPLQ